ncbi:MAG: hypothetical protein RI990_1155 [Planctomycetota bacterium]
MQGDARRNLAAWVVIAVASVIMIVAPRGDEGPPDAADAAAADAGSEKIDDRVAVRVGLSPQQMIMLKIINGLAAEEWGPVMRNGLSDIERQLPPVPDRAPGDAVGQAVLLARLGKVEAAADAVDALLEEIEDGAYRCDPDERRVVVDARDAIHAIESPGPDRIDDEQAERLRAALGPAGETLVAMARGDAPTLAALAQSGILALGLVMVMLIGGGFVALGGLVALVLFVVLAAIGKVPGAYASAAPHPPASVFAEVFAAWMVAFLAFGRGMGWLLGTLEGAGFPALPEAAALTLSVVGAFGATWLALWWGARRMGGWGALCGAIGLVRPRASDLAWGAVTWAMGVFLLACGLVFAFTLSALLGDGTPQPTHPIQELVASGSPLVLAISFFLAAVTAPITEEIAFRGALYRNLRQWAGRGGPVLAAVVATVVSSVLFAAIHPQGLIFVPVLGGLAAAFCISREWTGRITPAIVAHAINNAVIVGINVVLVR